MAAVAAGRGGGIARGRRRWALPARAPVAIDPIVTLPEGRNGCVPAAAPLARRINAAMF